MMLPDDLQELRTSREDVYGPWWANMRGTSSQMHGLMLNYAAAQGYLEGKVPFPIWWAPLMMCAVKLNRIASGNYVEDNFKDLKVYLSFVETMQKEEAKK